MSRKITQIATVYCPAFPGLRTAVMIHALADDGTVWEMSSDDNEWRCLPELPATNLTADGKKTTVVKFRA